MIFEYFVPGYIFISTFQFLTSRKYSQNQITISIVISYILKSVFSFLHRLIFIEHQFAFSERAIILIIVSFLCAIILTAITEFTSINKLLLNVSHKSIHDNIWKNVIDFNRGTTLKLNSDNKEYIGKIVLYEEKGNDSWFVLKDYIVHEDDKYYNSKDALNGKFDSMLAINIKNVDTVELFYSTQNN